MRIVGQPMKIRFDFEGKEHKEWQGYCKNYFIKAATFVSSPILHIKIYIQIHTYLWQIYI